MQLSNESASLQSVDKKCRCYPLIQSFYIDTICLLSCYHFSTCYKINLFDKENKYRIMDAFL